MFPCWHWQSKARVFYIKALISFVGATKTLYNVRCAIKSESFFAPQNLYYWYMFLAATIFQLSTQTNGLGRSWNHFHGKRKAAIAFLLGKSTWKEKGEYVRSVRHRFNIHCFDSQISAITLTAFAKPSTLIALMQNQNNLTDFQIASLFVQPQSSFPLLEWSILIWPSFSIAKQVVVRQQCRITIHLSTLS